MYPSSIMLTSRCSLDYTTCRDDDDCLGCADCRAGIGCARLAYAAAETGLDRIETVVVIYAENRSFDNLYGRFPGANGLANVSAESARQFDRDGTVTIATDSTCR
jgi:phospholipase C